MKGLIAVLLLLLVGTAVAQDQNISIDTNETLIAQQKFQELNVEHKKLEKEAEKFTSRWKKSLSSYIKKIELKNRLKQIDLALDREDAPDRKRLERERSKKQKMLNKIDPQSYASITYYLEGINHTLDVEDKSYIEFEKHKDELKKIKQLTSKRQKLLKEMLLIEPSNGDLASKFERNKKELNIISKLEQRLQIISDTRLTKVNELRRSISELDERLNRNNIWQKSYSSYLAYVQVKKDLEELDNKIELLDKQEKSTQEIEEQSSLEAKRQILSEQINLLQTKGTSPFTELLKPDETGEIPQISDPFDIFTAISFNKTMKTQLETYKNREVELNKLLKIFLQKRELLEKLATLVDSEELRNEIATLTLKIDKYKAAHSTLLDTASVYEKHIEEVESKVDEQKNIQMMKLVSIGGIILFLLIFFFIIKQILKRYISDNDRFYMANKGLTFTVVLLVILILLFNYIENASYIVTVLGFASAGIAIAMKDWFMSILGWLVIVFGGSIHVGDRVKVNHGGVEYVGDVLDISLLRITILEDVTLTTYMTNRRAGRIIFIPNNYVFTNMIANYTHISLKTVWDGIDITITFDSNHKKAQYLAKEISRKFAKGYTDITRKQLNKLRSGYSLKNTNVEPRIFAFAEENGIRISAWYLTNAYATLTLRSTISMEIIDAYNSAEDIQIAYPTQMLHIKSVKDTKPPFDTSSMELV